MSDHVHDKQLAELMDRLAMGTITPEEHRTLTARIGQKAMDRIIDAEHALRDSMSAVSRMTTSEAFLPALQRRIAALPTRPLWLRLLIRWSGVIGIMIMLAGVATVIQVVPHAFIDVSMEFLPSNIPVVRVHNGIPQDILLAVSVTLFLGIIAVWRMETSRR